MLARDALCPWRTALENAELGAEIRGVPPPERRQRALELLDKVGLKGFENAYPKALSQGMRQRVALARTFSLDAPILLMDEPFGALDAQTKLQLEDVLLSLWQREQRTVVFVTHDLSEAVSMSDRVVVMSARPGRIVADVRITLGRPRSVRALQKDPAYHELYSHVWTKLEEGCVMIEKSLTLWAGPHQQRSRSPGLSEADTVRRDGWGRDGRVVDNGSRIAPAISNRY